MSSDSAGRASGPHPKQYRPRNEDATGFPRERTALLVIDPVNDFLSEGGAAWEMTKSTVEKNDVVTTLRRAIDAARAVGSDRGETGEVKEVVEASAGAPGYVLVPRGLFNGDTHIPLDAVVRKVGRDVVVVSALRSSQGLLAEEERS